MSADFADDHEFSKLLAGQAEVDLIGLMLEFARDAYPALDREGCVGEIERLRHLATEAAEQSDGTLRGRLSAISGVLYGREGFHGNDQEYYDPRNSYLNEVLERRSGIPISLGILYMAVSIDAGVEVFGVGTPSHFVLGATAAGRTLYVDPFANGDVLSRRACQQRVEKRLSPGIELAAEDFRPARHLQIAARVLRNLKAAYAMADQWDQVMPVQTRLSRLLPELKSEQRDLALVYLRTGQPRRALDLFDEYLKVCQADEMQSLEPYMRSARRLLAEMN